MPAAVVLFLFGIDLEEIVKVFGKGATTSIPDVWYKVTSSWNTVLEEVTGPSR